MTIRIKVLVIAILLLSLSVLGIGIFSVRYILGRTIIKCNEGESDISILSWDDVVLSATEHIVDKDIHQWAILVHSYRTDRSFMQPYEKVYRAEGYNTISPDNRAHGSSGGKYIGMGYLDQYDIQGWINYVLERDPEADIILHGVSMGASTLMILSGEENFSSSVKAIIADCGYTSAIDYLSWKLKQRFHLPAFPILPIANMAARIIAGYYLDDASALEAIKNSTTATLFIHGTDDMTVPIENVYRLYDAASCQKKLYVVEEAGHGEAIWFNEQRYWKQIFDFIDSVKE